MNMKGEMRHITNSRNKREAALEILKILKGQKRKYDKLCARKIGKSKEVDNPPKCNKLPKLTQEEKNM